MIRNSNVLERERETCACWCSANNLKLCCYCGLADLASSPTRSAVGTAAVADTAHGGNRSTLNPSATENIFRICVTYTFQYI